MVTYFYKSSVFSLFSQTFYAKKNRYTAICALGVLLFACEPVVQDGVNVAGQEEARRQVLVKEGVESYRVITLNAEGDTLQPQELVLLRPDGQQAKKQWLQADTLAGEVRYVYDTAGRLVETAWYWNGKLDRSATYSYNEQGLRANSMEKRAGYTDRKRLVYGADGQIVEQTEELCDSLSAGVECTRTRTVYAYEMGRCITESMEATVPSSNSEMQPIATWAIDYDSRGRKIRRRKQDGRGMPVSEERWEYTPLGHVKYEALYLIDGKGMPAMSSQYSYTYTKEGLLHKVAVGSPGGEVLQQRVYQYTRKITNQ